MALTSRFRRIALAAAAVAALGACTHAYPGPELSHVGDANRMTMAAQVVDPDPQYETLNPPTSAEHAGQAAERYRGDKVKQPVRETISTGSSGPS
jgi:hypothetical protein